LDAFVPFGRPVARERIARHQDAVFVLDRENGRAGHVRRSNAIIIEEKERSVFHSVLCALNDTKATSIERLRLLRFFRDVVFVL